MIRQACALVSLLVLVLQGSSGGHILLVEHTRCAEHGELVHSDGAHHHEPSAHAETAAATFEDNSEDGAEEAHEHCALTADRRDAVVAFVSTQTHAVAGDALERAAALQAHVVTEQARFRIAPKNSPPA